MEATPTATESAAEAGALSTPRTAEKSKLEQEMEQMLISSNEVLEGGARTKTGLRQARRKSKDLEEQLSSMTEVWATTATEAIGIEPDAELTEEGLRAAFDKIDVDGNGRLTAKELEAAIRSVAPDQPSMTVEMMISHADKDGDSMVSFDEFRKVIVSLPTKDAVKAALSAGGASTTTPSPVQEEPVAAVLDHCHPAAKPAAPSVGNSLDQPTAASVGKVATRAPSTQRA